MEQTKAFRIILADTNDDPDSAQQLELFALLNLGLVQSMVSGVLSAKESIQRFYCAENCLYVKKRLGNREANEIMSRGVQLSDLFDALPTGEAQREFLHELETMRSLCLKLLEKVRFPGVTDGAAASV